MDIGTVVVNAFANFGISVEQLLEDIDKMFRNFFIDDMTPPKKYGMHQYEKKYAYADLYKPYKCNHKPQKNLPYQRHIY